MGAGVLKTREPKSVTVGIRWWGRWNVIGDRGDKQELEVQVKKDAVVDSGEPVKLELGDLGSEPLGKGDLVVVEVRPLEDIEVPLALLCMHWQVVNVACNGGLP